MLNSQQVKDLFDKESILISRENAVPLYRVRELFGDRAVCFARNVSGSGFSLYGIGDFQLPYATLAGFQAAATFQNIDEIRETVGESAGYDTVKAVEDALIPGSIMELVDALRYKYPHMGSCGIIREVLDKAINAETKRKNRQKKN